MHPHDEATVKQELQFGRSGQSAALAWTLTPTVPFREETVLAIKGNPREIVTLEELAISNSFEIAALIEVLEEKGLLTKAEVLEMVKRLKTK